jgi:hypothetical protein
MATLARRVSNERHRQGAERAGHEPRECPGQRAGHLDDGPANVSQPTCSNNAFRRFPRRASSCLRDERLPAELGKQRNRLRAQLRTDEHELRRDWLETCGSHVSGIGTGVRVIERRRFGLRRPGRARCQLRAVTRFRIASSMREAISGCASWSCRNSVPNMTRSLVGEVVVTVALRRPFPRIAISPKKSPGPSVARSAPPYGCLYVEPIGQLPEVSVVERAEQRDGGEVFSACRQGAERTVAAPRGHGRSPHRHPTITSMTPFGGSSRDERLAPAPGSGPTEDIDYFCRSGLLPGPHASPGLNA